MDGLIPQVLLDGLRFPEGPRWHGGKLWFSDILAATVTTLSPTGRSEVLASIPGSPSGLGFLPDGALLIVSMKGRQLLRLDGGAPRLVADLSGVARHLNDMVVDAQGRAYVGDVAFDILAGETPAPGQLLLVTPDGHARVAADAMAFPNGSVITPDGRTLIVAESFGHQLTAFDIAADGSLANRRVFASLGERTPDGICLDAEGAVWVGCVEQSEFVRVTAGGAITDRIPVPGKMATACALGGEDRRTLFLLTSLGGLTELRQGTVRGAIETVQVAVPGAGLP